MRAGLARTIATLVAMSPCSASRGGWESFIHPEDLANSNERMEWRTGKRMEYSLRIIRKADAWLKQKLAGKSLFGGAARAPLAASERQRIASELMPLIRGKISAKQPKVGGDSREDCQGARRPRGLEGIRNRSGPGTCASLGFALGHVSRMHDAPPRGKRMGTQEPLDRPTSAPGEAIVDLLRLLCNVNMDRRG